jgi:hypothetical protein
MPFQPGRKTPIIGGQRAPAEFKRRFPKSMPLAANATGDATKNILQKLNQIEERLANLEDNVLDGVEHAKHFLVDQMGLLAEMIQNK